MPFCPRRKGVAHARSSPATRHQPPAWLHPTPLYSTRAPARISPLKSNKGREEQGTCRSLFNLNEALSLCNTYCSSPFITGATRAVANVALGLLSIHSVHTMLERGARVRATSRRSGEWKQFGGYRKRQEWMEMTTTTRVSEIKHQQFRMISVLIEISLIVNNVKKRRIISFLPFSLMNVKCACNLNTIQETKQSLKITLHKTQGKISY